LGCFGTGLVALFLVAQSADHRDVVDVVLSAFAVREDVVYLGAAWCLADVVVEDDVADRAVR